MKKFPTIFIILLASAGITAFAITDNNTVAKQRSAASARLMDQLTDELFYLVQLSDGAGKRIYDEHYRGLAQEIQSEAMAQNRELCSLIIKNKIPAKRDLNERHQQAVFSIISNDQDGLALHYNQLLQEEFQLIDSLILQQEAAIDDPEITAFSQQLTSSLAVFTHELEIFGDHKKRLSWK